MKKILIGILIVLLSIMAYYAIFKGIAIGKFQILSVAQIQDGNDKLSQEIAQTETLMHSSYPAKTDDLDTSISKLLAAKEEYQDLASVSTDGELSQASKQESYKIEYLWTRIGSHATGEGVILKLDISAGGTGESDVKNLTFTVTGNYIAVINFVSAIEDDSQLGFRIENFKILPGTDADARLATFTVRNVRIKPETTTQNVTPSQATTENTNNNTPSGNTTNTATDNTANTQAGATNTAEENTNVTDNTIAQ